MGSHIPEVDMHKCRDHWREKISEMEENNRMMARIKPVGMEELKVHWMAKYVDGVHQEM